jgi:iron complex outermembrane receptor protein
MVINIITHNAQTFEGTEITSRLGAIEEFYSGELKHGQKFDDNDGGLFIYTGIGKYVGADKHDAPQIFPFDFPSGAGFPADGTQAGEPLLSPSINRDGETHRDLPPLKLHVQITKGDWDIWARYTRGGQQGVWDMERLTSEADPNTSPPGDTKPNSYGYQQATAYVGHKKELTENITLDMAFSYDMSDFERYILERANDAYREDEYHGKALLRWQPNDQHKFAFGGEITHNELGLKSPGWPDMAAINARLNPMPRWSTNMYSILGEHQWTISDQWTSFLGARIDDHTYTERMFSPRASLVYTPNRKDTYKLMWARSVRANFEEEMKAQAMAGGGSSNPEKLDSIELRYERQQSKNLDLAASVFVHYNLELISWSQSQMCSASTGTQRDYGAELEASYHTEDTRLMISHGYTKLYDFSLEPGKDTYVTAKPYGYGDDLANWSNHITKLTAQHKLDDKWTLDASLRIYWGFPGMKDWNNYRDYANTSTSLIESGWERAYRGNYYLNLGLQYKPSNNLTIGLTGYNLLGIFNEDFNKRNYLRSYGDFRDQAVAVAVSVTYKF